jgi:hypothetical protein
VQRVLTATPIKQRIGELAIGYAADCDRSDSDIGELLSTNLPDAKMLPFVAFLTPTGQWITGASGYQEPHELIALMNTAAASPLMNAAPEVQKALAKPAATATAAAAKGDWKPVLAVAREAKKTTGRCPERTAIAAAEKQARDYAAAEFAAVLAAAATPGDLAPLKKRLTALKAPYAGEPEATDCDTGLKALQQLQFVRDVEARGNPAKDLRARTAEPFQGTRWTALFVPAAAAPPASDAKSK